ncbi:hypothetical protein M0802_007563 [Mischocyttarus mexicanus]|nr:hypothetical protein M0802_007563 [Mischocyttarus mexicanus]
MVVVCGTGFPVYRDADTDVDCCMRLLQQSQLFRDLREHTLLGRDDIETEVYPDISPIVLILFAFYDMHELHWDYSFKHPVTIRHTTTISRFLFNQIKSRTAKDDDNDEDDDEDDDTLQPTDPPIFEVMNIIINETATQVAIWGNLGIAIMELPKRWGKDSAFQGGKDIILCTARTGFAWTYQEPLTAVPPNPYFKTPD